MMPIPMIEDAGARLRNLVAAGLLLSGAATLGLAGPARAAAGHATWQPEVSERLVKLPSRYLKKSIDRDFAASALAQAMQDIEAEVELKLETLKDLGAAIDRAEDEVRVELRHQFLAEKQAYLELLKSHQDLKRKHLGTRAKVYARLLKRLNRGMAAESPEQVELIKRQEEARQRLDRTVDAVDMKLFGTPATPDSKYSREYSRNLSALNTLIAAIQAHPMTARQDADEGPLSKPEYLRRLIADNQADRALLDQEGEILGYMAKLVALDATALAEDLAPEEPADADVAEGASVTVAVDLFVH